ncbi:MAG TPA: hypothetical protein PLU87_04860 [Sedimentisphaerales bacterium]|nr:hypothetical protein [Sedimentisphaerales bacterium]HRS11235.1 hypothetical protein [Sedimentisphaerales bacterium]HRV47813.1 hypothetical protein [Sedimentisphaerales bacterium]
MRKREFLLTAVLLAVAITAPARAAPSFWAGFLLNGAFRWGSWSTPPSANAGSNANAAGFQYAEVDGTTGAGVVVQTEGAAGFQDGDEDSQEQSLAAGMTQIVANTGDGSALAVQGGAAGQTQTNDCGTQSQYVSGIQYAYVSTSEGGSAVVTQTATVVTYQSQECGEAPDEE